MRMDEGLDTGPMLLEEAVPIGSRTTAATLHDALAAVGARLVLRALDENPPPRPQPSDGSTYAPKLAREDGLIDWSRDAAFIERQVRALNPWPGTFSTWSGATLKVLDCAPAEATDGEPGTVLDDQLTVACGTGAVRLLRVQAPGGSAMAAADFLRGHPVPPGAVLGR
jgi:methionyl-tRNA formyltransferase